MPVAGITGRGLTAIAVAVVLLWGCLIAERLIVRHANLEAARAVRAIRLLQKGRRTEPVSVPLRPPRPRRPDLG